MKYKEAGVDIEAGDRLVAKIKSLVKGTLRPEVISGIGGFGGLFHLDAKKYKDPVLVAGTDGVGTKLKVATLCNKFDTMGIDLVAMCVNDLLPQGAEPLFFLDYLAVGRLKPDWAEEVIRGIAKGCEIAGCALLGGETAEMPGVYPEGEYELAGFAVGVVERDRIIDGSKIKVGDRIIGLASNGLHSNGYSLVRRVFRLAEGEEDEAKRRLSDRVEGLGRTLGEELLEPTRIYVRPILELLQKFEIRGIAHITGGGMVGNIPRILPEDCKAVIHKGSWPMLPIFSLLQKEGEIPVEEMFKVFNMGIGMVVIVPENEIEGVKSELNEMGETSYLIGEVDRGNREVEIR
ncbi:phosphoribosylformylglycinamidine cyclo-ligase [bacterium]|nr:phosphoribosylformylglycinamidine cyclo-ligase [bacterium]MCK4437025.1 phosphoribosylformylglycinamidine cyclo-ligase [bacterium]